MKKNKVYGGFMSMDELKRFIFSHGIEKYRHIPFSTDGGLKIEVLD